MEQLIEVGVQMLGAVAMAVLVPLLIALAVKGLKRMGIDLDIKRQQQLESMARQAILKVEEVSAEQAKRALREWTGPQKLEAAVADIVGKLPRVDHAEATSIVKAVLPTLGMGAAAGAAELGKALRTQ